MGDRPPSDPVKAFAPGRINLIGEHTDYNGGLCLPFAIERGVTVTAQPTGRGEIEALALDLREVDRFDPRAGLPAVQGWRAFVRGVVAELWVERIEVSGARLEISGNLPREAGLASSAALCVSLCLALAAVSGADPPADRAARIELARLCSRVEAGWAGAQTGLLDQLAILFGRPGCAVRLDLHDLEIRPVPLGLEGWTLATIDSGATRSLAGSGYNRRRAECREACEALGLASLRDASRADLPRLPERLARRVRHVLSENERVEEAVAAIERRDLPELGHLLDASHRSLRDDYEVSLPAVEKAVRRAKLAGAAGARMVGGGFGGHVLALFPLGCPPPPGALTLAPGPGAQLF